MTDDTSQFDDKLAALRASYSVRLHQNLEDMDAAARKLAADTPLEETHRVLTFLRGLAHRIAGSGATFGFSGISERAYELEALVERLLSAEATLLPAQRNELCGLTRGLLNEAGSRPVNALPAQ